MATVTGITWGGVLELVSDLEARLVSQNDLTIISAKTYTDQKVIGKNTLYFEPTMPVGGVYVNGDMWFDVLNNNEMYKREGNSWVSFSVPVTIPDLSITVLKFKTSTHMLY